MNPYLTRDTAPAAHWADRAACNQPNVDPELWFGDGESSRRAAWICNNACPVKVECLTDALSRPVASDHDGVFGGLTGEERQALRRRGCCVMGAPSTFRITGWDDVECAPGGAGNTAGTTCTTPVRYLDRKVGRCP